jgi:hypothetical protein
MAFIHISVYLRASVVYNNVEDFYRAGTCVLLFNIVSFLTIIGVTRK